MTLRSLLEPVPLGIAVGLLAGKAIGVFGASAIAIGTGFARLPHGVSWGLPFGCLVLCGIGFMMRLFIANLAFGRSSPHLAVRAVLGILVASVVAAVVGYLLLTATLSREPIGGHD